MSWETGSVLGGRYRLISQLGSGGMGTVWHARDERLDREVAVKIVFLPQGLTGAERAVIYERTLREARSAARLSHPAIVTVHDVFEENGRPCIVMEFIRARSLEEAIDENGRMPPVEVAEIGYQMLAALRVAHAAGIVHRDVKPANVLLAAPAKPGAPVRVVITDFGIAATEGEKALTHTGMVLGSPSYIAPERVYGERAGPASDLWALGATMYAAVEGRPPYDHSDPMETLLAVSNEQPAPPRHSGPLTPVLAGLLTKDPSLRMPAARAAEELARVTRTTGPPPSGDPDPALVTNAAPPRPVPDTDAPPPAREHAPSPPPRATRRVKPALYTGLAVLVAAAAVSYLLLRHGDGGREAAAPAPSPPSTVLAGFQRAKGPGTATLAVPHGWSRRALSAASVRWTERGTGAYVQVDAARWGVRNPVDHWRGFVRRGTLRDLRVLRRGPRISARGWPAADLEFTWAVGGARRLGGHGRAFTANGHQYAILVAAPTGRWSHYADLVEKVFGSFVPAR
jgi:eukaryotic-like serine/threonine-protein kinase